MFNNSTSSQWLRHPSTWTQSPWQSSPWTPSPWLQNTTNSSTMDYYGHLCGDIEATTEKIVYSIFMIVLLLCSLLGNTVVVSALLLSNKLTERSTFYFVASLGKFFTPVVSTPHSFPFLTNFPFLQERRFDLQVKTCVMLFLDEILFDGMQYEDKINTEVF